MGNTYKNRALAYICNIFSARLRPGMLQQWRDSYLIALIAPLYHNIMQYRLLEETSQTSKRLKHATRWFLRHVSHHNPNRIMLNHSLELKSLLGGRVHAIFYIFIELTLNISSFSANVLAGDRKSQRYPTWVAKYHILSPKKTYWHDNFCVERCVRLSCWCDCFVKQ